MLHLRYSPIWQQNAEHAVVSACKDPTRHTVLLVPEQRSFDMEWALCAAGGSTVSRYAEVLSFTRLADRVFSLVGGSAIPTLEKSGRLIAMASTLEQIRSRLKIFGRHITKPEFLLQLLEVVDEFKSYSVDRSAVGRLGLTGAFAQKLDELCLILEAYDAVCSTAKQDPSSKLDRLTDALYDSDYADNKHVIVQGFSDFTVQELHVLEALMLHSASMTVYLTLDDLRRGQQVFSVPRATAAALCRLASKHGIEVPKQPLAVTEPPGPIEHLRRTLFAAGKKPWTQNTDAICLTTAQTAFDECDLLAGSIQQAVRSGARYRDIAVVCTDPTVYRPILDTLFTRYEIPGYFTGGQDLLAAPAIRAVLSALEAASCGMDVQAVAEYLKSGFCGLDADVCDRLENYALLWNIHGSLWEEEFTLHPGGYGKTWEAADRNLLTRLNEAKTIAIGPLFTLRDALRGAVSTEAQVQALSGFLETIGLEQRLAEQAQALSDAGSLQQSQVCVQVYGILSETMEQIFGVIGATQRSPEEFFRFFRAALSQHSIGTVPIAADCVQVGDLSSMRGVRTERLYLLGASDGSLPSRPATVGLLSDSERRILQSAGLTIAPDNAEHLDRSLFTAYVLLTAPSRHLYVSCIAGEESYLFSRMAELFPGCSQLTALPFPVSDLPAARLVSSLPSEGQAFVLERLPMLRPAVKRLTQLSAYSVGTLSKETVKHLYGKTIHLSSTKIDKFASCKFAYYLSYGLKAKELKPASVDAPMFGNFVHKVLENVAKQVVSEGGFANVSEERLMELTEQFIDQFVRETLNDLSDKSERASYIVRRSFQEVFAIVREVWMELRQSGFHPVGFEVPFDEDEPIRISGKLAQCYLTGYVDRVDLYQAADGTAYLRIVDYKTGTKEFKYSDILCGIGLQMLIYLFSLTGPNTPRFPGAVPAGVMYMHAKYPVVNTDRKLTPEEAEAVHRDQLKRSGLLLDDPEVLWSMEPSDKPVYLDVKRKDSGEYSSDYLATAEQFALLKRHVIRAVAKMTDDIFEGKLEPDPYANDEYNSSCHYCEYKSVCHVNSGSIPVRRLRTTKADRFWAELEKEDHSDG